MIFPCLVPCTLYPEPFMASKKLKILVIHGPNLNLLGERETSLYGKASLKEIDSLLTAQGKELGVQVDCFQSNSEGDIIEALQKAKKKYDGILINPAAYTHTSVAIRDAILAVAIPTVEVHLSNIYQREDFRHHSFIAPVAVGQVSGFGAASYEMGLLGLVRYLHHA